jgi:hypothetical protein
MVDNSNANISIRDLEVQFTRLGFNPNIHKILFRRFGTEPVDLLAFEILEANGIGLILSNEDIDRYNMIVCGSCRGKYFFTTRDGYKGESTIGVQEHDHVVQFAGLSHPMIVRTEEKTNHLIGPACVYGIMDGERWPKNEASIVSYSAELIAWFASS